MTLQIFLLKTLQFKSSKYLSTPVTKRSTYKYSTPPTPTHRYKRPGCLMSKNNKILKPIRNHRFCVLPPVKNHPSKPLRFCVLPAVKNHPSKAIGLVYFPLWKITHQRPSVLCTPPFEKSLFLVGAYFGVGVYFGKYGVSDDIALLSKFVQMHEFTLVMFHVFS